MPSYLMRDSPIACLITIIDVWYSECVQWMSGLYWNVKPVLCNTILMGRGQVGNRQLAGLFHDKYAAMWSSV